MLSLKARLSRLLTRRSTIRVAPPNDGAALERRSEPRFDVSAAASLAPRSESEEGEDEDAAPNPTKVRAAPRPQRRASGGYALPPLELLAAPKASGRAVLSADLLAANATALEGVLGDFGTGGDALRA